MFDRTERDVALAWFMDAARFLADARRRGSAEHEAQAREELAAIVRGDWFEDLYWPRLRQRAYELLAAR